jgi:steroid 5-alpha reductase family enzyme
MIPIPGDTHNLLLTFLVTCALQLSCFFVAYLLAFDKITDLAGSANFILLALLSLFLSPTGAPPSPRAIAITTIVCVARLELACYLLYRVLKRGKDARFDAIRESFWAFLVFWVFQILWVWGVSLPVVFVNSDAASAPPWGASDSAGVALFAFGFLLQVVADAQKDAFRGNPANSAKWCAVGVWAWSRHPNFFGEICLWWGVWVLSSAQLLGAAAWAWPVTLVSPLLTMLILLAGSGIPSAEGDNQKRWMRTPEQAAAFAAYRSRTSPLIPLPPACFAATPRAVKRWALCEFKMYEVTEDRAGTVVVTGETAALSSQAFLGGKRAT